MDIKKEKPGSQMAKKLQEGLSKADEAGKKLGKEIKQDAVKAAGDIKKSAPKAAEKFIEKAGAEDGGEKKGI